MKPIRVLQVVRKMDMGGVQSMIMNYYRNIDRSKVQFDFIVQDFNEGFFDKEILEMGSTIYRVSPLSNLVNYYKDLSKVLKNNKYSIIHIHQNFANIHSLLVAFIYRVPNRIAHSHNSFPEISLMRKSVKVVIKHLINRLATHKFACSKVAAEWLYGKKQIKKGNVLIINNAIDIQKFEFNNTLRIKKREELGLANKIIIGHIGYFGEQKNHDFLIDIFSEVNKLKNDTHLLLIGLGVLEKKIIDKVDSLGLTGVASFLGSRPDVNELLSAFDIFIFPSLYEGLPVTIVEAQAAGLKCIISDEVTKEVLLTNLTKYISLKVPAKEWAKEIINEIENNAERKDMSNIIKNKGYDIAYEANKLERIYVEMISHKVGG